MKKSLVRGWLLFFVFLFCLPVTLHAAIDREFPVPSLVAEEPIAHVINFGIDFKESAPSSGDNTQIANIFTASVNRHSTISPIPQDLLLRENGFWLSEKYVMTFYPGGDYSLIIENVSVSGLPEGVELQMTHLGGKKVTSSHPGIVTPSAHFFFDIQIAAKTSSDIPLGEYTILMETVARNAASGTSQTFHDTIGFEVIEPCKTKLDVLGQNIEASDEPGLVAEVSPTGYLNGQGSQILESDIFSLDPTIYRKQGFTADGNARLLLRAQSNQPGYIVFSLSTRAEGFALETLKRDYVQTPSSPSASALALLGEFVGYDEEDQPIYQATTVLVAPKEFAADFEYPKHLETVFVWQVDANDYSEKSNSMVTQTIQLYAPPVVLMHGLWGTSGAFGGEHDAGGVLHALNNGLSVTTPVEYLYDGTRGPSDFMTPDEETLYNAIKKKIGGYFDAGIVCTKVDIVTHSMGGLMARQFLLNNKLNKESRISYGNGLVRRLITIATPHRGTNWASYFIDETDDLYKVSEDIDVRDKLLYVRPALAGFMTWVSDFFGLDGNMGKIYRKETRRQADGTYKTENVPITALVDLARSSRFIQKMEESSAIPDVPLYSISGNVAPKLDSVLTNISDTAEVGALLLASSIEWMGPFIHALEFVKPQSNDPTWMHTMFKIMVGDSHDMIVENQSSQWKLPDAHHSLYTDPADGDYIGVKYSHIQLTGKVGEKVAELLKGPESAFARLTSASSQSGRIINTQSVPASDNLLKDIAVPVKIEFTGEEGFVLNVSQTSVLPGATVGLEAVPLNPAVSADYLLLGVKGPSINDITIMARDSDNIYRGNFAFKENDRGIFEFSVALPDYEANIVHFSNKAQVMVGPNANSFLTIYFENSPLIATAGENNTPLHLIGVTRGNSRFYDVSNPLLGTTYEVEDSNIATVSDSGFLEAHAPGKTTLYAHFAGYTADVDVIVLSRDSVPEIPGSQKPANPTLISPLEGAVINGTTVVFEATPFDVSKGHTFSSSSWLVRNQYGQDIAYLDDGDSNTAQWIAPGPGAYQWSMKYYYDGFNTTESTPWTTFIVSGDIDQPVSVTGVTLTPSSADLTVGGTLQLTATVLPSNATSKDVTWSTSNASIVTVANGTVTGIAAGTATVTVTTADGGYTAESLITVKTPSIPATAIALTSSTLSLKEDEHETLGVIFTPNNTTNKNVTWSTSNSSVATVVNGTITARGVGTATITATAEDGGLTASCTIEVTQKNSGGDNHPERPYYEEKYPGKNVIFAPEDGSQVTGTDGEDVIVSGSGDDWLEGAEGSDIYVYNLNDGNDVLSNVSNEENDQDELHFGPGVWEEDLTFAREENDLLITILDGKGGNTGTVTIEDWYLAEKNKLSKIVFDDGTELTAEEIEDLAGNTPHVLTGTASINTLRVSSLGGASSIVYGLAGNDTLYAGTARDILIGGAGNDRIYARSANEGGGKKIFWWHPGDGNDTIDYYNAEHQAGDGLGILRFGDGISPENVEVQNNGNNVVLVVTLPTGSGNITFTGANQGNVRYQPDEIHFADGTGWTWSDAANQKVVRGTTGVNSLRASSYAGEKVTVYGLAGNDTLYGGAGEDTFIPGPGNDTVNARSNNATEGGGKKVFWWNPGDGNDTINYYNADHQPGDRLATLHFGEGIRPEDVEVQNSGNNTILVITLATGSGNVTFVGANRGDARYQPDEIHFADGTIWTWNDAVSQKVVRGTTAANTLRASSYAGEKVTVYGLAGNDTLYGGAGEDTFVPGPGNDTVNARSNNATEGGGKKIFWWNPGDGNDTINYYNADHQPGDGLAILRFGEGISPEDVEVQNSGNNTILVITPSTGSGNVTFVGSNRGDVRYQPDKIQFANGTVWTWSDAVSQKVVRGTTGVNSLRASSYAGEKVTVYGLAGNDTLYGGAGEDTFVPGPGNDTVNARSNNTTEGGGKKIFWWNAGDGNDTINYYNAEHQPGDGLAILKLGSGVAPENVEVQNNANNAVLVITLASGGGNITFVGANRGDVRYQPDSIQFADGTVWTWSEVAGQKVVRGTTAANTLRASSYAGEKVTVYGLAGNDTLYGGAGEDTFIPGPGNDTVNARSNNATEGGGKKVFWWNPGDGNDTINYYNAEHQPGDGLGILKFGEGITASNVTVQSSGNNTALVITLASGSGKVTFNGANRGDVRYQPDEIQFADGTVWNWATMPR